MVKYIALLLLFCNITCAHWANAQTEEDYYNRGIEKGENGNYPGSIQDFSKAIELAPNNGDAYYNRGYSKFMLEDNRGAIQDFNKAIEFNPKYQNAYHCRGLAKISIGEKNSGCLDLSKAGELGCYESYEVIKIYCR